VTRRQRARGAARSYYGTVRVRIVVLNWNGRAWLSGCFTALERVMGAATEVVLVDNASADGSLDLVRERFPWVQVRALSTNAGFARGNNVGAAGFDGDYLVFLNNDTEVASGWLDALIRVADARPDVGLVTSNIVFLDRQDLVDSAGDGYLRCGGAFKIGHGQSSSIPRGDGEVFGACGAAFLIRRALFERLGGFDERLFMVYEDVDLSYRARLVGARVWFAANAVVGHAGSAAIGRLSPLAVYYGQRNLEWVWIQNSPRPLLWRSLAAHVAYSLAAGVAYARQRRGGTWLAAKCAAIAGLPGALMRRRRIQATVTASPDDLWRLMTPDWIAVKRQEKLFAFAPPVTSERSLRSPGM
jgi:GT2 family glycosyltransferase